MHVSGIPDICYSQQILKALGAEGAQNHDCTIANYSHAWISPLGELQCVLEPNLTGCSGNHFPEAAGQFHVFFSLDRLILTARNTHKIFKTHLFL